MKDGRCLAFDIDDLLTFVAEVGAQWSWGLIPIGEGTEIIGERKPFGDKTVLELSGEVDASKDGILMSWEQLLVFAAAVDQTIWGTYVACRDPNSFPKLKSLYLDGWAYVDRASAEYYEVVEV